MPEVQTVADIKDTGVTVAPDDVINEILPFCSQGQVGRDLLSQADYTQDMQRNIGHQPGIARAMLANKQARQVSHMAAGLAQFLARRYAPGVLDDGDLDKIEAALVSAIKTLRPQNDASLALCESEGATAVKAVNIDEFELAPGARIYLRFSEVNAAVNPKISINGGEAKSLLWRGAAPKVGDLAMGQVYEIIYTGTAWQILSGMAPWSVGQYDWWQDDQPFTGLVPCNGCTIANASQTYPQILVYLATAHGQARCFASLDEREAAHVAAWGDGEFKAHWAGVGGLAKFFYDSTTDTLYLPDLVGMFEAMAADGIIAPSTGGVAGDRMQPVTGQLTDIYGSIPTSSGAFGLLIKGTSHTAAGSSSWGFAIPFDSSRVVPTGATNAPRSWGALACVYLGQPSAG